MSLHTDRVHVYACVWKEREGEREGERDRARAESSEGEVRDKQMRARKRVKRTGHHKDGENERKKMHAIKRTII
jgi:hypothetical protein